MPLRSPHFLCSEVFLKDAVRTNKRNIRGNDFPPHYAFPPRICGPGPARCTSTPQIPHRTSAAAPDSGSGSDASERGMHAARASGHLGRGVPDEASVLPSPHSCMVPSPRHSSLVLVSKRFFTGRHPAPAHPLSRAFPRTTLRRVPHRPQAPGTTPARPPSPPPLLSLPCTFPYQHSTLFRPDDVLSLFNVCYAIGRSPRPRFRCG